LLKVRPRSEAELRQRLGRHGFGDELIERAMMRLRQENLIGDASFAGFWRDNRLAFSPRSKRMVQAELSRKGVPADVVKEATSTLDDETAAYEAARKKLRSLGGLDFDPFRARLGGYLQRRGFDFEVTRRTVMRVWEELHPL